MAKKKNPKELESVDEAPAIESEAEMQDEAASESVAKEEVKISSVSEPKQANKDDLASHPKFHKFK